jgi:hypothetical protein
MNFMSISVVVSLFDGHRRKRMLAKIIGEYN